MGISKNIRMAMVDKNVKVKSMAEASGLRPQNVSNNLSRDNMTIQRAEMLADILGCDIVLRDRETGKIY